MQNTIHTELDLPFRGQRNYLHGTDYYLAAADCLHGHFPQATDTAFELTIHKFATRAVCLDMAPVSVVMEKPASPVVEFKSASGCYGWLRETEREVERRIPFDEQQIAQATKVDGKTATLLHALPFSPIEILVIMVKQWHEASIVLSQKRWVFVKLELERLLRPEDARLLSVELSQNLANRLTRMTVKIDGKAMGSIHFAAVPKG